MEEKYLKSILRFLFTGLVCVSVSYACSSSTDPASGPELKDEINKSVSINISTPSNGSVFTAGTTVDIVVSAQDSDGIKDVELWIGNSKHSADASAPFSFSVSDLEIGSHSVKAKVQDVLGYSTESATLTINIGSDTAYNPGDYATAFDGGILVPERREVKLVIYNGNTDTTSMNWTNSANVLWSMSLRNADGVASEDMDVYNSHWGGGTSINEAKRVIHNGKNHIIAVGNGRDGIGMYEFDTKKCVYWGEAQGGPHSVEYLPGGILAVANPKGSGAVLELYKTTENNKGPVPGADISFAGIHGVVWSDKQKVLWVWGGSKLRSYSFNNNIEDPKLTEVSRYLLPEGWEGAGHDASPMSGTNKLLLACNQGIITFDTVTKVFEIVKLTTEDKKYKNNKGLSYNPITKEIIMIKSDDGDGSYRVRSITNADRLMGDDKRAYKTRWFYVKDF